MISWPKYTTLADFAIPNLKRGTIIYYDAFQSRSHPGERNTHKNRPLMIAKTDYDENGKPENFELLPITHSVPRAGSIFRRYNQKVPKKTDRFLRESSGENKQSYVAAGNTVKVKVKDLQSCGQNIQMVTRVNNKDMSKMLDAISSAKDRVKKEYDKFKKLRQAKNYQAIRKGQQDGSVITARQLGQLSLTGLIDGMTTHATYKYQPVIYKSGRVITRPLQCAAMRRGWHKRSCRVQYKKQKAIRHMKIAYVDQLPHADTSQIRQKGKDMEYQK